MEPFGMRGQAAPGGENKNEVLDDIFKRVLAAVVRERGGRGAGISDEKLRQIIDRGAMSPDEAQRAGLIDAVKDENDIDDTLAKLTRRRLHVSDPDWSPQHPPRWGRP